MKGRVIGGGGLISRTVLVSATTNYVVPPSARWLYVKVWGGGGERVETGHDAGSGAYCKVLVPVTLGETLGIQSQLAGGGGNNPINNRYGSQGGNGYGLFRASSPLVIAGGGGGVGGFGRSTGGRRGGFPNGSPLLGSPFGEVGNSGTQTNGGQGGFGAQAGGYLFGGDGLADDSAQGNGGGGGGGGGYYGGGGGTGGNAGLVSREGGGGSSFSAPANENIFMSDGQHAGLRSAPPPEAVSDIDYAFNASRGSYREFFGAPLMPAGGVLMVIYAYRNKPDYSNLP